MLISILDLLKVDYSNKIINCVCFNLTTNNKTVVVNSKEQIKKIFNNLYFGNSTDENINSFDIIVSKNNKKKIDILFVEEDHSTSEIQAKIIEKNIKNIVIFSAKENFIKVSNFLNKNMSFLNILRITNDDIKYGITNDTYMYNPKILTFISKLINK